jgi:2-polyprenyl-3-methyl-5-hydroxy-6-metoxy-1,4-benzoquinol methylase
MSNSTIIQDVLKGVCSEEDVSNAFFELANTPIVRFRFPGKARTLQIHQDSQVQEQHTGGIVWETSVLLLNYLLLSKVNVGKSVLELGAGCGLLGLGLALANDSVNVTVTDTAQVVAQVHKNVTTNQLQHESRIKVCALNWIRFQQDAVVSSVAAHSFDTIVATDVLFSPELVQPLLETMQYFAKPDACMYLCVQIRCAKSHALFLQRLGEFGWISSDVTDELRAIPECEWGLWMGCHLFRLTRNWKSR